jgi:hypothetical protein
VLVEDTLVFDIIFYQDRARAQYVVLVEDTGV